MKSQPEKGQSEPLLGMDRGQSGGRSKPARVLARRHACCAVSPRRAPAPGFDACTRSATGMRGRGNANPRKDVTEEGREPLTRPSPAAAATRCSSNSRALARRLAS